MIHIRSTSDRPYCGAVPSESDLLHGERLSLSRNVPRSGGYCPECVKGRVAAHEHSVRSSARNGGKIPVPPVWEADR